MIETVQYFEQIDQSVIDKCLNEYQNTPLIETNGMNKNLPSQQTVQKFINILEPLLDKKLTHRGGNYYRHSTPYNLHTDYKTYLDNTLNVVIPLVYVGNQPKLVIFDQIWDLDSVTWCMHKPVLRLGFNTGVKGCPYEYPVQKLTGSPINDDLYKNNLLRFPKETLFGLSGEAYPFEPNSMIVFDNQRIHCTSDLYQEKIGLSLRFKVN